MNYRDEFDLDEKLLYLNSGTHSICPRAVVDAVARYARDYERNPTMGLVDAWPRVWKAQRELAAFFGAEPTDLFLRANVTMALNEFIQGAALPRGSEIVATDLEYGAIVNACRLRAERDGLRFREAHLSLDASDEAELVEGLVAQLKPETSMLLVSHVMTGTGLIIPLERLARETRSRGILLVVDGAHAPGAIPLDFSRLGDVDFYGGNLHKWMLGPKGTAFGWVHPRHQPALRPLAGGWTTFAYNDFLGDFGGGSRFAERMIMLGCVDFAPFFALTEMLAFWRRQGADKIRARLGALQACTEEAMSDTGWRCVSPPRGRRAALVAYDVPEKLQPRGAGLLRELFEKHRLQVNVPLVQGRWRLRLSPHVYNTEDEIARASRILKTL